ncbi:hypothetical protein ZWY2020_000998 [Hordeum vulgare]|nr:hypothetical protein ZWY2020_000998 [Hordeum vulgare]
MELAKFSPPQIKRIVMVLPFAAPLRLALQDFQVIDSDFDFFRAASLEREVVDTLMLVKNVEPDVREGRRRQYNYIGGGASRNSAYM